MDQNGKVEVICPGCQKKVSIAQETRRLQCQGCGLFIRIQDPGPAPLEHELSNGHYRSDLARKR